MQHFTLSPAIRIAGGTNSIDPLHYTIPMLSAGSGASVGSMIGGDTGAAVGAVIGSNIGRLVQENSQAIDQAVKDYVFSDEVKGTMLSMGYLLDYLF